MAKYYYNRYNLVSSIEYYTSSVTRLYVHDHYIPYGDLSDFTTRFERYETRRVTDGLISFSRPTSLGEGTYIKAIITESSSASPFGFSITKDDSWYIDIWDRMGGGSNQFVQMSTQQGLRQQQRTVYSRGTLNSSNIIAENGTYPVDGRSGSYWYVRGSIVTPGTPTSITVPTEIKGGTTITISWGTSSNSDSFRLERQVNGGSWTQVYNGTAMSYSNTISEGTISVAYRVRGANGTAYSSYRTSSTVVVKNFPEMGIRVNGALKTSDAGWVRVGGQLREIDTIWVRINGALKEVQ